MKSLLRELNSIKFRSRLVESNLLLLRAITKSESSKSCPRPLTTMPKLPQLRNRMRQEELRLACLLGQLGIIAQSQNPVLELILWQLL